MSPQPTAKFSFRDFVLSTLTLFINTEAQILVLIIIQT